MSIEKTLENELFSPRLFECKESGKRFFASRFCKRNGKWKFSCELIDEPESKNFYLNEDELFERNKIITM